MIPLVNLRSYDEFMVNPLHEATVQELHDTMESSGVNKFVRFSLVIYFISLHIHSAQSTVYVTLVRIIMLSIPSGLRYYMHDKPI
jgi:hypothetical protein